MSTEIGSIDRRSVLRGTGIAAAALLVEIRWNSSARGADSAAAIFAPNAVLKIDAAGAVTVILPKTEMGQGVHTAIPMLIAEELEVDPATVRVEIPVGDPSLFGTITQDTGGSSSMRETFVPLRQAGANARAALIAAAAASWKVAPVDCRAENGQVLHPASGKSLSYGALVTRAPAMPVPKDTPLKPSTALKVVGTRVKRLDSLQKVQGAATFGIDVILPGMKIATLAQSPVFGGSLAELDENPALRVKGVRQVVKLPDAVVVIADHYWAARKGLDALKIEWIEGGNAAIDQAAIVATYQAAAAKPGMLAPVEGQGAARPPVPTSVQAVQTVKAVYKQPFLAHAAMEPCSCTVHVRPDGCEIWTGTQVPGSARDAIAKSLGLPPKSVVLHNYLLGGGFGRRLEIDMIERAVQVGKHVQGPVKLVWSREEDMQHDRYRPFYHDTIEADLDQQGKPVRWRHKITGSSIIARLYPDAYKGMDEDAIYGSLTTPYAISDQQVAFVQQECAVPTSWWRGVGGARGAFVIESFIDELAHATKTDPVDYRRKLLVDPRSRAVLDLVAEKSGWKANPGKGKARGVALINLWGTYMAQVVEVEMAEDGVRVTRVTAAVDCGQPVNPSGIEAQIQGGIIFGLSAGLHGEVTVSNGRIEQSNFDSYRILRFGEAPAIDVHIVSSDKDVGGLGEPPVATVMPALANAVFALTGKRVRELPVLKALRA